MHLKFKAEIPIIKSILLRENMIFFENIFHMAGALTQGTKSQCYG